MIRIDMLGMYAVPVCESSCITEVSLPQIKKFASEIARMLNETVGYVI